MVLIVGNKYKVIKKIGQGSFGKAFLGINLVTNEYIAIKIENKDDSNLLKHETKMYNILNNTRYFPKIRNFGIEGKFNYLIMDVYKKPLSELRGKITFMDCIQYAIQMFKALKCVHEKKIIHRDIKPTNFLLDENNKLYLIDFGLSKIYENCKNYKTTSITGTVKYVSKYIHDNNAPTLRDDVISVCYVLYNIMYSKLPWQNVDIPNKKERYEKIKTMKTEFKPLYLYDSEISEIALILDYCDTLKFGEMPNYKYILTLLQNKINLLSI